MKSVLLLLIAIISEVIATCALKESAGFTRLLPTLIVIIGYGIAFYLFTISLEQIPLGIAYAVWSGLGTAGTILVANLLWNEKLQLVQMAGIVLIIVGSVMVNLFNQPST
ncbi:small multidrug resistance pump [Laceyella sacchari]|uniref:DMT family transporter n=1 Tax=Laceyella sacchari TaxID=37482 RepID=UPI00104F789A|nr:multidrug efflux SMR transporter [Laceyella sacchari]TCW41510.1 small multidrug resistance pump [Laceyella sacchari]